MTDTERDFDELCPSVCGILRRDTQDSCSSGTSSHFSQTTQHTDYFELEDQDTLSHIGAQSLPDNFQPHIEPVTGGFQTHQEPDCVNPELLDRPDSNEGSRESIKPKTESEWNSAQGRYIKIYICPIDNTRFSHHPACYRHLKAKHKPWAKVQYQCPSCYAQFPRSDTLNKHQGRRICRKTTLPQLPDV